MASARVSSRTIPRATDGASAAVNSGGTGGKADNTAAELEALQKLADKGNAMGAAVLTTLQNKLANKAAAGETSLEEHARRMELAQKFLAEAERDRQLAEAARRKAEQ